jgi:monoterpene epsilon-lactone hydrolase
MLCWKRMVRLMAETRHDPKRSPMLVIIAVAVLFFGVSNSAFGMTSMLAIGGSSNVKLLQELNDNWKLPEGFSLEVMEVNGITMEWVQAANTRPDKVILQLHGGAYVRSLKDNGITYRRAAVKYAEISGAGVLTVDYRVAPQHPFPAALEDAVLAYRWLLEQGYAPDNIIIAGDSAGGGLALATVLYLRDQELVLPAGVITMSAWTNLNYRLLKPSYVSSYRADNPYISPVYGEYGGFPPLLMQVGGDEVLLNDTVQVARKAKESGVSVQLTAYPGMFHVFQMLFPELAEANTAWDEVEAFITDIFTNGSDKSERF